MGLYFKDERKLEMAIYDTIKSNMSRQELQLIEAGQHYKIYSAKVKYLPENIEKEDFFRLCYGMLTKCDEINVYTFKKDAYEVFYKFIVTNVDMENKAVTARLVSRVDFMSEVTEATTTEGNETKSEVTLSEVQKLIKKEIKAISEVIVGVDTKIEALIETNAQYQTDTDNQLEEIELKLEELTNGEESKQPESGESENGELKDGKPKDAKTK